MALPIITEPLPRWSTSAIGFERIVHRKMQCPAWMPEIGTVDMRLVPARQVPPVLTEGTAEVECADAAFASVLSASRRLADLHATLETAGARYCVFGGWLRDTLSARGCGTFSPRDVDIVAADIGTEALLAALPTDICRTMFGGVQSSAGSLAFDIWPLHETFLIRTLSMPASFENLLQTTDFNINAALYFPAQAGLASTILDAGMLRAIRSKSLTFHASHLPFPIIQCTRLLAYRAKLDLNFDSAVLSFVREILAISGNRARVIDGLRRYQPLAVAEKAVASIPSIVEGGH